MPGLPPSTLSQTALFDNMAQEVYAQGYSIQSGALPHDLAVGLQQRVSTLPAQAFDHAGVGRDAQHQHNPTIRGDVIHWITGQTPVEQAWLAWANQLQEALNRRLFLGLFSFESHFSHYRPGDFYQRHVDAFKGQANRMVSLVVYLNPQWQAKDGGELVLYRNTQDKNGHTVWPAFARAVVFLSEEFPHEVLPTHKDRYAIAGWFRVNTSHSGRIDPPR